MENQKDERVFRRVLDAAFKVHSALGPGLLEAVYETCLAHELDQLGLKVERQKIMPLQYGDVRIETAYRMDLLVEDCVVVEIKAVESLAEIHLFQTLTYLKFAGLHLALLVNFNVPHLKDGIRRVIH